ncbi:hypothetical protein [Thalassotalea ganghwensis]
MSHSPKDLGYIEVPFQVLPDSSTEFYGVYESKLDLLGYFRVSYKKYNKPLK